MRSSLLGSAGFKPPPRRSPLAQSWPPSGDCGKWPRRHQFLAEPPRQPHCPEAATASARTAERTTDGQRRQNEQGERGWARRNASLPAAACLLAGVAHGACRRRAVREAGAVDLPGECASSSAAGDDSGWFAPYCAETLHRRRANWAAADSCAPPFTTRRVPADRTPETCNPESWSNSCA